MNLRRPVSESVARCGAAPHRRLRASMCRLLAFALCLLCARAGLAQPAEEPATPTPQAETEPQPAPDIRDTDLPKLQDLALPSADELLTGDSRDWIVLKNSEVVICEPIVPRPDTLLKRQQEIDAKILERRGKSPEELERIQAQLDRLRLLVITLPEDTENPEYALPIILIERIIHHEDLVLQRIDALIAEGNIPKAFELLLRLETQWSNWPGAVDRHNQLLFTDGQQRLQAGNPESALVVFKDLRARNPEFAGLSDAIAASYGELAKRALEAGDNRAARHFLFQLDNLYPNNPVFQQYAAGMAQRANELLSSAEQAARDGQHASAADLAWQAAVFWPRTPNLLPRFRPLAQRYQVLKVGVVTLPLPGENTAAAVVDPAAARARQLRDVPVFEVERYRNGSAFYRTRYFESWEPFDLGRRLLISLRQTRQPWETQPILDAPAFVALLEQRLDPASPDYDERLAGYIESVAVRSPVELELRFRRVPARVEPLLASLVPTDSGSGAGGEIAGVGQGGFVAVQADADSVTYRRAVPEPNGLSEYHVAEIVERRYTSYDKAVLGLRQGEVSMLADLPDWILKRVQADPKLKDEMFIQPYALPTTHVLQLNPQSPALKIREFRRALLHAIDRDRILKQTVLRDPTAAHGRLVTSPFPSFSPANSFEVGQHSFDQSAALALVLAAAPQMDNQLPLLRMLVPPTPVERAAAEELIRYWKRVRIEVEIIDPGTVSDEDSDWDLCYRTLRSAEPTVELWPFLANGPTAQIGDLAVFPDWLRHALVDVDRTSDWGRALETIRGLHPKLWSEVRCLPLWEVDQFLVVRRNVQGFPERPMHCYHGIERWTMQSWYPAE